MRTIYRGIGALLCCVVALSCFGQDDKYLHLAIFDFDEVIVASDLLHKSKTFNTKFVLTRLRQIPDQFSRKFLPGELEFVEVTPKEFYAMKRRGLFSQDPLNPSGDIYTTFKLSDGSVIRPGYYHIQSPEVTYKYFGVNSPQSPTQLLKESHAKGGVKAWKGPAFDILVEALKAEDTTVIISTARGGGVKEFFDELLKMKLIDRLPDDFHYSNGFEQFYSGLNQSVAQRKSENYVKWVKRLERGDPDNRPKRVHFFEDNTDYLQRVYKAAHDMKSAGSLTEFIFYSLAPNTVITEQEIDVQTGKVRKVITEEYTTIFEVGQAGEQLYKVNWKKLIPGAALSKNEVKKLVNGRFVLGAGKSCNDKFAIRRTKVEWK